MTKPTDSSECCSCYEYHRPKNTSINCECECHERVQVERLLEFTKKLECETQRKHIEKCEYCQGFLIGLLCHTKPQNE